MGKAPKERRDERLFAVANAPGAPKVYSFGHSQGTVPKW